MRSELFLFFPCCRIIYHCLLFKTCNTHCVTQNLLFCSLSGLLCVKGRHFPGYIFATEKKTYLTKVLFVLHFGEKKTKAPSTSPVAEIWMHLNRRVLIHICQVSSGQVQGLPRVHAAPVIIIIIIISAKSTAVMSCCTSRRLLVCTDQQSQDRTPSRPLCFGTVLSRFLTLILLLFFIT